MRLEVLGCSAGIGNGRHTMSLLVDDDILIDAGTGLSRLSSKALGQIDHVFLTHAHLDHVGLLPLLIDAGITTRSQPLTVHGIEQTLETLREHIFNWSIWPDMTVLPTPEAPALRYAAVTVGKPVRLRGRSFTALPAAHTIPTVGFRLDSGDASVVVTGDTAPCEPFWALVAGIPDLRALIVEVTYHDDRVELAGRAGHLCPSTLAPKLAELKSPLDVYVVHSKPSDVERIEREASAIAGIHRLRMLKAGDVLTW